MCIGLEQRTAQSGQYVNAFQKYPELGCFIRMLKSYNTNCNGEDGEEYCPEIKLSSVAIVALYRTNQNQNLVLTSFI